MALFNDYTDIEDKLKTELRELELSASIVIPFHYGYDILAKTVTSLTQQTYSKDRFEVIIAADANHTDAKLITEKYEREINIKLVTLSSNGWGAASSRNAGIRVARNDVIISLDADMICPPSFLESHMVWFHKSGKIATIGLKKFVKADRIQPLDIVRDFCSILSLPGIHSISNNVIGCRKDKRIPELNLLKIHPFPSNCFHGGNVAYWRDDALDVGLWDEGFNGNYGYEDIEFGQRLFEKGRKLVIDNYAITYHQENKFVSPNERQKGLSINRAKLYERHPALGRFRKDILGLA